VLAWYWNESDWTVVTTRRLIWSVRGVTTVVPLDALREATISSRDLESAGGDKGHVDHLTVITTKGESHRVPWEAGAPLSGLWNALKLVLRMRPKAPGAR